MEAYVDTVERTSVKA
ncbi:Protein of unknown function [Bacillus mycoides]|uniref:Uncharacterized protein n=1 Tax=Bacillus mycoides TaxID=1405 RepID=A0A1D3MNV1_BACMY|nr:Protein of unknown function [Bacillus mycoides]SCM87632.1 Protein of unknown function [Bacillus mycoides]